VARRAFSSILNQRAMCCSKVINVLCIVTANSFEMPFKEYGAMILNVRVMSEMDMNRGADVNE
jgi:hypothetical protein